MKLGRIIAAAFFHFGLLALAFVLMGSSSHSPSLISRCLLGIFTVQLVLWAFVSRNIPQKMKRGSRYFVFFCLFWTLLWGAAPQEFSRSLGFALFPIQNGDARLISSTKTRTFLKNGTRTGWNTRVQFETPNQETIEADIEMEHEPELIGAGKTLPIVYLSSFPTIVYARFDPAWIRDFNIRLGVPMVLFATFGFLLSIRPTWASRSRVQS